MEGGGLTHAGRNKAPGSRARTREGVPVPCELENSEKIFASRFFKTTGGEFGAVVLGCFSGRVGDPSSRFRDAGITPNVACSELHQPSFLTLSDDYSVAVERKSSDMR